MKGRAEEDWEKKEGRGGERTRSEWRKMEGRERIA